MKTILAPIDSSAISRAIVKTAAELAQALNGRVALITVVQPPVFTAEYSPVLENIAEIVAIGEKASANLLAKYKEELNARGISAVTDQFTGSPIMLIVEQAEKINADYIVMGSHGHTAFYDLLVGSTTHGVLKRAKCPVVIVPSTKTPAR